MRCAIVPSSELGKNCWLPIRFVGCCFLCYKYETCRYPERVQSEEYSRLLSSLEDAKEQVEKRKQDIEAFRSGWG